MVHSLFILRLRVQIKMDTNDWNKKVLASLHAGVRRVDGEGTGLGTGRPRLIIRLNWTGGPC